jgi:ribosomal protein S1
MADYGAFVEIAPGVEGLIHVFEMSWSQHLRSAQEFMKVGDEVEAVILTLDRAERKMSLGSSSLSLIHGRIMKKNIQSVQNILLKSGISPISEFLLKSKKVLTV